MRASQITQHLYGPATTTNGPAQTLSIASAIGYDAAGRVTSVTHTPANGLSLPAGIKVQDIVGPLSATYSYDANGNRSRANYSQYDGSGGTESLSRSFTLNAANNRVEAVADSYSQSNGSTLQENHALQWDASGSLSSDGKLIFEYDPRGRINKITSASGSTSYQTNALGQRVGKVEEGNQITDTVYGEEELGLDSYPLGNYKPGDSSKTTEYIYLPTADGPMPVAVQIGNALYAIDSDHLNTPRRLTDSNGRPVWQWVTTGFGELEPTTAATGFVRSRLGTGTPAIANTAAVEFNLRYPGQQYDAETGLYYNHHRTYDPYLTVGYTQADPLGLDGGWNRFSYVTQDPVNGIDPLGLFNPMKGISAMGNAVIAGFSAGSGGIKIATAIGLSPAAATGVGALPPTALVAWGTWNLRSAAAAWERSKQQWSEAMCERWSQWSWKSLYGMLPGGTNYDDPGESSGPLDYIKSTGWWHVIKEAGYF